MQGSIFLLGNRYIYIHFFVKYLATTNTKIVKFHFEKKKNIRAHILDTLLYARKL